MIDWKQKAEELQKELDLEKKETSNLKKKLIEVQRRTELITSSV